MVTTFIIWIYVTIVSFVVGVAFWDTINHTNKQSPTTPMFALSTILGFIVVSIIGSWMSLVMPLNKWASVAVLGLTIFFIIIYPHRYKNMVLQEFRRLLAPDMIWAIPLLSIYALFFISQTVQPVSNYDTGLYHAQAIRWIEEFRVIPGLGNLHGRLAFSDGWFISTALFSFSFLKNQSFHVINGWLIFMATIYLFTNLSFKKYPLTTIAKILFVPFLFFLLSGDLSSPSPDMPTAVIIWLIVLLALEHHESKTELRPPLLLSIILLISFVFTLKLSTITLLLIPIALVIYLLVKLKLPQAAMITAITLFALVPASVRSLIHSGYLIYPSVFPNIFHPNWKIPVVDVIGMEQSISNWAKVPHAATEAVFNHGLSGWILIWYKNQPHYVQDYLWIMIGLLIVNFAVGLIFLRRSWVIARQRHLISTVVISLIAGVGLWFFSAPTFRFGYGLIIAILILLMLPYFYLIAQKIPPFRLIMLFTAIGYSLVFIYHQRPTRDQLRPFQIYPADYLSVNLAIHPEVNDYIYTPATGEQCWYSVLPCTPYPNQKIKWRGQSIQSGFQPASN